MCKSAKAKNLELIGLYICWNNLFLWPGTAVCLVELHYNKARAHCNADQNNWYLLHIQRYLLQIVTNIGLASNSFSAFRIPVANTWTSYEDPD